MRRGGKRFMVLLVLGVFMSQLSLPVWEGTARAWADTVDVLNLRPPSKSDIGVSETDAIIGGSKGKPNVLFFIEASAVGSFSPKGVMPTVIMRKDQTTKSNWWDRDSADWAQTRSQLGYTFNDIQNMMSQATFGIGALPVAFSGQKLSYLWERARSLYGREVDLSNNWKHVVNNDNKTTLAEKIEQDIERNKNNYYFPFSKVNPKLGQAYEKEDSKLAKRGATAGTIEVVETYNFDNYDIIKPDKSYPYALVFKDPRYWQNGWRDGATDKNSPPTLDDLVPNDSKMYQTKLVLWRLLEEKPDLFKGIRFGLASTFLSLKNRFDRTNALPDIRDGLWSIGYGGEGTDYAAPEYNGIFKTAPYGNWVKSDMYFDGNGIQTGTLNSAGDVATSGGGQRLTYWNGAMFHPVTGQAGIDTMRNGATFPLWLNAPLGAHYRTHVYNPLGTFKQDGKTYMGIWEQSGEWGEPIRNRYKTLNRASLLVPITDYDHVWEKGGVKMTQVEKFKMWIDGLADIKGGIDTPNPHTGAIVRQYRDDITGSRYIKSRRENQFHYYNDPELGVAGSYNLPMAIYPDPTELDPSQKEYWGKGVSAGKYIGPVFTWTGGYDSLNPPNAFKIGDTKGPRLDRDLKWYRKNKFVWYALKDHWVDYFTYGGLFDYGGTNTSRAGAMFMENRGGTTVTLDSYGLPSASYNAGSGEAAGSIIDFFSPPVFDPDFKDNMFKSRNPVEEMTFKVDGRVVPAGTMTDSERQKVNFVVDTKTYTEKDMDDVSFPIICDGAQDNFVILIASGMDLKKQTDNGKEIYAYHTWDAIKNLYDHTSIGSPLYEKATVAVYGSGNERTGLGQVDWHSPIRTIVIGVVADPKTLTADDIKKNLAPGLMIKNEGEYLANLKKDVSEMRRNLLRMAVAGQGGDPYSIPDTLSDTEVERMAKNYMLSFADDPVSLMTAIESALIFVKESQIEQPGQGGFTEPPVPEPDAAYSTTYRIAEGNQWIGELYGYKATSEDGKSKLIVDWKFGEELLAKRGARNLKYWNGNAFTGFSEGDISFKRFTGMTNERMDPENLLGDTFGGTPPDNALYKWFQGYDYSYAAGKSYPRANMLSDFGQSEVVYARYPQAAADSGLPGYNDWASGIFGSSERLYAQTNDGILHVIVPSNGDEESALLPPPSLLPSRLAALKTIADGDKLHWLDVTGEDGRTPGFRSNPLYMLDGSLQRRPFDLNSTGQNPQWGNYLIGTLGRGGKGLYMLDITQPNDPKFLWYRENVGSYLASMEAADSEPTLTAHSSVTDSKDAPYKKLGFNSPKPGLGVSGGTDQGSQVSFIALPGGTQSSFRKSENGNEGAVLLFIDPAYGSVIRAFDSSSSITGSSTIGSAVTGASPYMGMMLSEPTMVRSRQSAYLTGRVLAADNRGNIFVVNMVDEDDNMTPLSVGDWNIKALASLQKDSNTARTGTGNYALPYGFGVTYDKQSLWVGGGTSDVMTKRVPGSDAIDGVIKNESQMIFGFKVPEEDNAAPYVRGVDFKMITSADGTLGKEDIATLGKKGWYIPLESGDAHKFDEYVSTKPVVIGTTMYISTFTQTGKIDIENRNPCSFERNVSGYGRLYVLDLTSGAGLLDDGQKCVDLDGFKITSIGMNSFGGKRSPVIRGDKLYDNDDIEKIFRGAGFKKVETNNENENAYGGPESGSGGGVNLKNNENVVDYWIAK
jgi:hypothetical protein